MFSYYRSGIRCWMGSSPIYRTCGSSGMHRPRVLICRALLLICRALFLMSRSLLQDTQASFDTYAYLLTHTSVSAQSAPLSSYYKRGSRAKRTRTARTRGSLTKTCSSGMAARQCRLYITRRAACVWWRSPLSIVRRCACMYVWVWV